MIIQISSGQGPAECELAVSDIFKTLKAEYPDIKEISARKSRFSECYTSIMFETEYDIKIARPQNKLILRIPAIPFSCTLYSRLKITSFKRECKLL